MTLRNGDKIRLSTRDGDQEHFFVVVNGELVNPENGVTRSVESLNAVRSALTIEKVSS